MCALLHFISSSRGYAPTDRSSFAGEIEFPVSLVRLALARECNISQRHSAAVLLKNYVDTQWSEKSAKFRGPEPPAEVTALLILVGLFWWQSRELI